MTVRRKGPLYGRLILLLAILASCATQQKIETSGLRDRHSLILFAEISEESDARTRALTRQEGGTTGAAAAGQAMSQAIDHELGLWIIALAPIVVPVTFAVGSAAGASSSSPATREQIEEAIGRIKSDFVPQQETGQFEAFLLSNMRKQLSNGSSSCIVRRGSKIKCGNADNAALLKFEATFQIAPSRHGAAGGDLDFVGHVTVSTDPPTLLKPQCVTWVVRRKAGNLFELANSKDQLLMRRFRAVVKAISAELPGALFGSKHGNFGEDWTRVDCVPWQRALAVSR